MSKIRYDGPGELHITNITEACEIEKSSFNKVVTVCQNSIVANLPSSIEYSFYCMADGSRSGHRGDSSYQMFANATNELFRSLDSDETVLIHSDKGTSRSISVATAALGRLLNEPRSEALSLIHYYRPRSTYPDSVLMEHANQYIYAHTDIGSLIDSSD
jgi:hypothetical protein